MADKEPQSYRNHAKLVPAYHYLTTALLLINLLWALWKLGRAIFSDAYGVSLDVVVGFLLAVALLLMFYYLRVFPLAVQDRLIRLEMRLRLREVLPPELHARIDELTPKQFVALRFAGDAELPELVRSVLDGKLTTQKDIKREIKDWQADHLRC